MTEKEQSKSNRVAKVSPFSLERSFSDPYTIFSPNVVDKASSKDILIVVDTNVLLLPYTLGKSGIPTLHDVYKTLKSEKRLFLPARVGREFIRLRDMKLGELLKTISDIKGKLNNSENKLPPILDGVAGIEKLQDVSKELALAKKNYIKALDVIEQEIVGWSGNDPVTSMYSTIFNEDTVISLPDTEDELLAEWERRLSDKAPPGYKDGGKDDLGIGDYLIWKCILRIGAEHKKDMIFVTSDEKADWFIRSNNRPVYPRPELIAEYRREAGGKNIRLASLHDVLREMAIETELVAEVENAEIAANLQYKHNSDRMDLSLPISGYSSSLSKLETSYGGGYLHFVGNGEHFNFEVSECTMNAIYIYPNDETIFMGLNIGNIGAPVNVKDLAKITQPFMLSKGQIAFAERPNGAILALRLESANHPSPTEKFEIVFSHVTFPPGYQVFVP